MKRAADLFCSAGGAGAGLARAGFQVTGMDIKHQPRYPFDFVQGDALALKPEDLRVYDFIWASPPCQAHTSLKTMHNVREHLDLIPQTRALLKASGVPYCIENVMGSPLEDPFMLCGSMFGLGVHDAELRRHRCFETSYPMFAPKCQHIRPRTIGIYGEGCRDSRRKFDKSIPEFTIDDGRSAMQIDWMTTAELSQAIPPAYSEFIARAAIPFLRKEAA